MRRVLLWICLFGVVSIVIAFLSWRTKSEPQISRSLSNDHIRIQRVLDLLNRYATDSEGVHRKPVYPPSLFDLVPKYMSQSDFSRLHLVEMRYNPIQTRTKQRRAELIVIRNGVSEILGLEDGTIIEIDVLHHK